jgi:hypothetical protein
VKPLPLSWCNSNRSEISRSPSLRARLAVEIETGVADHVRRTKAAAGEIDTPVLRLLPEIEIPDAAETTTAPGAHLLLGIGDGADRLTTMMVGGEAGLDLPTTATAVSAMLATMTMTTCHSQDELRETSRTFKSSCWTILIGRCLLSLRSLHLHVLETSSPMSRTPSRSETYGAMFCY